MSKGLMPLFKALGKLFEALGGIIEITFEPLKIIMFNEAAERMLGCPAGAAIGQPISNFIAEQDYSPDAGSTSRMF